MTKKNLPAESKPTEVAPRVVSGTTLPSLAGASPELQERMLEVRDNMESVENFKLPRVKMTGEGFELIEGEPTTMELVGVLIHTRKTNVYYAKPYNPSDVGPPDCFSSDGITPDASIEKPVSKQCKGCPMSEFGTNAMKSGKACRNLKPLYLLLSDNAIIPRQLIVTPTSLKAANQYLLDLTERSLSYRKVRTKITAFKENAKSPYVKLKFSMVEKLSEQQVKDVEFLKNQWLPAMNNQVVDQREIDTPAAASVESENGRF